MQGKELMVTVVLSRRGVDDDDDDGVIDSRSLSPA
jgi:hypothetical protein